MSALLEQVLGQPAWVVYLVVGLVVLAEDAIFVGFVIPGETAAILGGVSAVLGNTSVVVVACVVVAAAVVGDSIGYEVGRVLGPRLLSVRLLRRVRPRIEAAEGFIRERGPFAVFLARWTAFLRAVVPALAGSSRLPYRTFLAWNALGGLAWGTVCVTGGYLAGHSYRRLEQWLGTGSAIVVVAIALVVLVVRRRRRSAPDTSAAPSRRGAAAGS